MRKYVVSVPRKHHFVSRFLLRGFAVPEKDEGQLFVLDYTRNNVFPSSPANSGHRRDYNRVDKATHPDPLIIEDFFADIESRAAPALQHIRGTDTLPPKSEASKVLDLVAIHLVRTPSFRRWLEGKYLETIERKILSFASNAYDKQRFARKQRDFGLPEDCWTPEGFLARMKSGDFAVRTDDNWKIAFALQMLPLITNLLQQRTWVIISDAAVGLLGIGSTGPKVVGVALPDTLIYLPIASQLVLVGVYPEFRPVVEKVACPRLFNTVSFGMALDQCFSPQNDFVIDDPDRGPTKWTTCQQEGRFPKLFNDARDLAAKYGNRKS